jgi:Flp pilus assembly protein TadG
MTRKRSQFRNNRRGAVSVLACFLMIALLAMLAFAIDLGYLANSQTELQRSADSAALASCYELVYQGTPGTPVNLSTNVQNVPTVAGQYAGLNHVCNSVPSLATGDVVVGYMADPTKPGGSINTGANQNSFNAVQVTVRRDSTANGKVPTFFGRVFGVQGEGTTATATAALIANFNGFQVPGNIAGTDNVMILPYALDQGTWNALLAGDTAVTTDVWNYTSSGQVAAGADGIREVNLFPQGTGSPGNRGTVYIGTAQGTSDIVTQILNGISPADLAVYGGQLTFDSSGNLYLSGKPGISAGAKAALTSIIGQTRMIPIFASVKFNGANATYDIVQFVCVRILSVDLTGSMSSKNLTVQPALMFARGGIPATSGTQMSYGVYSPVWLVK